jgi:solute:Na+ symporter, SSS family
MLVTLLATIAVALAVNRAMGGTARLRHRVAAANMPSSIPG